MLLPSLGTLTLHNVWVACCSRVTHMTDDANCWHFRKYGEYIPSARFYLTGFSGLDVILHFLIIYLFCFEIGVKSLIGSGNMSTASFKTSFFSCVQT